MIAARRVILPLLPPMPRATPSCYRLLTLLPLAAACCPSVRPTAPHCLGSSAYDCCQTRHLAIATAHAACYAQLLPTADLVTLGCCPSVWHTAPHCLGACGFCRTRCVAIAATHASTFLTLAARPTPWCFARRSIALGRLLQTAVLPSPMLSPIARFVQIVTTGRSMFLFVWQG
ncbi:hypothetical protein V8C86DRAFT_2850656 [Haematococcus lacustris]